jgi:probable HAF family extracellular repeat protein
MNRRALVLSRRHRIIARVPLAVALLACTSLRASALSVAQTAGAHRPARVEHWTPYALTPIGNQALAIDASGRVAITQGSLAYVFTPSSPNGATGDVAPLGTLGGTTSVGEGMNALGNIVGFTTDANGAYHAFLFASGTMFDIQALPGGSSSAYAINALGQIVGFSYSVGGEEHGFLWTPSAPNGTTGSAIDLGTLGGDYSEAHGINVHGDVAGYAYLPNGAFHAFRYSGGVMTDLGTLGGSFSKAEAINDAGLVVGTAYLANGDTHAVLWDGTTTRDLGHLSGGTYATALAIDSSGARIVGEATVPGGQFLVYHAFLYANGSMQDLNDVLPPNSGWVLETAASINDFGQIAGTGTLNGAATGFLLTPN